MLYPIFYLKTLIFCIFTPKTPLVKENYFLTLWNFTYLKDTSFGKKSCNFEHGLETKNEFEKWPHITFFQCSVVKRPAYGNLDSTCTSHGMVRESKHNKTTYLMINRNFINKCWFKSQNMSPKYIIIRNVQSAVYLYLKTKHWLSRDNERD